jgi:hypothetical protein
MRNKENILLLIPLLSKVHAFNSYSRHNLDNFLQVLFNSLHDSDSIFSFLNPRLYLSIFDSRNQKFNKISPIKHSQNEVKLLLYNYFELNSLVWSVGNIDFFNIIEEVNRLNDEKSPKQIFCFTITSNKQVYNELKPYLYFQNTDIIYRNIDIQTPPLLSVRPKTTFEQKRSFYNIVVSSDLSEVTSLFKKSENK